MKLLILKWPQVSIIQGNNELQVFKILVLLGSHKPQTHCEFHWLVFWIILQIKSQNGSLRSPSTNQQSEKYGWGGAQAFKNPVFPRKETTYGPYHKTIPLGKTDTIGTSSGWLTVMSPHFWIRGKKILNTCLFLCFSFTLILFFSIFKDFIHL